MKGTIQKAGGYDYYWFTSNTSFINPNSYWEHVIAVSNDGVNQDVDLFVSVIDGRYPTAEDYDFKSDFLGPDDVIIRSNDSFWQRKGYFRQFGVLIMVGVRGNVDRANYTLMMTGPQRYEVNYTTLSSSWI